VMSFKESEDKHKVEAEGHRDHAHAHGQEGLHFFELAEQPIYGEVKEASRCECQTLFHVNLSQRRPNSRAHQRPTRCRHLHTDYLQQRVLVLKEDGEIAYLVGHLMEEHCSRGSQAHLEVGRVGDADAEAVGKVVDEVSGHRDDSE